MAVILENVDKIVDSNGNELVVADAVTSVSSGSGGSIEMVATGTLANGDVVSLRSDGTVEVVIGTPATAAETPVVFESAVTNHISATFDSNSNKVVIAYRDDGNSYYGTAVVGTVSGYSITFGTPVVFHSTQISETSATFDSNSNKVIIAYRDNGSSNYGTAVVGTVSGTSISFGNAVVFEYALTEYISATFDSFNNKVVIAYEDGNSSYSGTVIVGTVSGTSISFGTPVVFDSYSYHISATFDSFNNKVVIAYQRSNNNLYGTAIVGTVSGTTISFGDMVAFESSKTAYISATFDSNSNKVVIAYRDEGNGFYGTAVVGTVSGTSISFGTPVVFNNRNTESLSATFYSNSNKVVIPYRDGPTGYGHVVVGTVSGTSISFGTPVEFESGSTMYTSATFDSNSNKVVIAYIDNSNSNYGTAAVFQVGATSTTTNADNWMGIYDGTSGTVKILGGVAEGLTGLTVGATYYVNYDGTLITTDRDGLTNGTYGKIGRALSSTTLLITHAN